MSLCGTVQRDSSAYYKRFLPDDVDLSKKTSKQVAAYNPVLTDQTMRAQTDLKHIFNAHPDISGLSLLLDDVAQEKRLETVSIEDFLPPKDHYDIFDMEEFIENSKDQFRKLPIDFRMQFDNDPMALVNALDNDTTSAQTIAALSNILNPAAIKQSSIQSGETTGEKPSVQPSTPSVSPGAVSAETK